MASIDPTAVDFLDSYAIYFRFRLVDFFYTSREEDDEVYYQYLRDPNTHEKFVPHDTFHTVGCLVSGWSFEVCYHSVSDRIELKAANNSWRLVYEIKATETLEDDADEEEAELFNPQLEATIIRADGDFFDFNKYALALKLTIGNQVDDWDYKFPGYVLSTSRTWTDPNRKLSPL